MPTGFGVHTPNDWHVFGLHVLPLPQAASVAGMRLHEPAPLHVLQAPQLVPEAASGVHVPRPLQVFGLQIDPSPHVGSVKPGPGAAPHEPAPLQAVHTPHLTRLPGRAEQEPKPEHVVGLHVLPSPQAESFVGVAVQLPAPSHTSQVPHLVLASGRGEQVPKPEQV